MSEGASAETGGVMVRRAECVPRAGGWAPGARPAGWRGEPLSAAEIRILVASDRTLIRGGLVALLDAQAGLRVIAQTTCDRHGVTVALGVPPDVVVVDVDSLAALETLRDMVTQVSGSAVVGVAGRDNPGVVKNALACGVTGLVDHDASPKFFVETIRQASVGRQMIDPNLAVIALRAERNPLTTREQEVLKLLAEGASNGEIAAALCLSIGTVRNYVGRILKRMQARSRVDAVRMAVDAGWL